ncbi:MAG TPA: hypothetical protein DCS93_44030 [Microscillaceae bacterium]|nr:hypothetical protein [Microscillaceae bacterium]
MNLNVMLLQMTPHMYQEYHADYFIKQPWNAISSLVFFIPITYWILQLKPNFRKYPILTAILPLLFLNGLGSTLFHAFKPNIVFGLLDALPPMLMVIFLSSYFWRKVTLSWSKGVLIVIGCYGLNILMMYVLYGIFKVKGAFNVAYLISGLTLLTPAVMFLMKTRWQQWKLIALALTYITLALVFRVLDKVVPGYLPVLTQGTHFLWHIFSAFAVFPLGRFLIHVQDINYDEQTKQTEKEMAISS